MVSDTQHWQQAFLFNVRTGTSTDSTQVQVNTAFKTGAVASQPKRSLDGNKFRWWTLVVQLDLFMLWIMMYPLLLAQAVRSPILRHWGNTAMCKAKQKLLSSRTATHSSAHEPLPFQSNHTIARVGLLAFEELKRGFWGADLFNQCIRLLSQLRQWHSVFWSCNCPA